MNFGPQGSRVPTPLKEWKLNAYVALELFFFFFCISLTVERIWHLNLWWIKRKKNHWSVFAVKQSCRVSPSCNIISISPMFFSGRRIFSPCSPFRLLIPVFHANRNGRIRAGGSAQHSRPIPCSTVSLFGRHQLRESCQSLCAPLCVLVRCTMST